MTENTSHLPRRTFAIISHPDAGKTTLTEKLLLYGGALNLAGSVTAKKNQRATTSDWMELEKQRGISISSTVLQFDYSGFRINLLDTPGHRDFSEDTYRVLTAVDAAVMIIDAGKGVEPQTEKLFEVCRRRGVPIFTFFNKLDRPARPLVDLLDELERVLGIAAFPMNWPIGSGEDFCGVFDRIHNQVHLFQRTVGGAYVAPETVGDFSDQAVRDRIDPLVHAAAAEELELLQHAGAVFDAARVRAGELTPAFFGSASNNFGVQLLLDGFLQHSPPPAGRCSGEAIIEPGDPRFSGFVFKIQANMDPRHRDRIAFVRVVSGRFERDMQAIHVQSGKRLRLSNSQKLFGQDRETVDEAMPGDVVGLVGNNQFAIGDTLGDDRSICYDEIPRFAPECFAYLQNPTPSNFKRFRLGLTQLLQEGVVQNLNLRREGQQAPLLAAVGPLQFEVVQHRLKMEYGAESRLQSAPWTIARWVEDRTADLAPVTLLSNAVVADDEEGNPLVLLEDEWALREIQRRLPKLNLLTHPPDARADLRPRPETGTPIGMR